LQHTRFGDDRYLLHQTNICGKRLLQQYKLFVARGLFQQNRNWWRQVVISTSYMFVAGSWCTKHTFCGKKTISTNLNLVVPSSYLNEPSVRCDKLSQQYKVFRRNNLGQQNR
jgi:hypothetical protein